VSQLDLTDIQGNVLRGVRAGLARHFMLQIGDPAAASLAILSLTPGAEDADGDGVDDDGLRVSTAREWNERPPYFMTLGLTHAGLAALGLPSGVLAAFPEAFRGGPTRVNANSKVPVPIELGDVQPDAVDRTGRTLDEADPGHPKQWAFGGTATPPVHLVVSIYADPDDARAVLDEYTGRLHALFDAHHLTVLSAHDAQGLPDGKVHFGYRDGIAQPRVEGAPGRVRRDMQPTSTPGEFLLGKGYVNQYGGNFLLGLPEELGANGTYGALRMVKQDVRAFEDFLELAGKRANMSKELIAAKLMGRWRNGKPLTLAPEDEATPVTEAEINRFDYAPTAHHPHMYDDADGMRCPIGSHARRMNPRGALVMGKPHSRRIIRRGMPYGPVFDPTQPDDGIERGLIGYFVCGDIEAQFEFLQSTWGNRDFSTSGIRGEVDPILGSQPDHGGSFTIRTDDGRDPISLGGLRRWVVARGAAYCFLPGIGGLRYLGERRWEQAAQPMGYPSVAESVGEASSHPAP
jgi:deferrochelatase/peroxidase EfeB